ncbi:energy-coupling factor transporter ATPase [Fusibacter ferrireducens]|uniref:Energy-coupling factor transporter ATP-binding protein EcfA2 n=1 Tax=Fusibacter ferrireducens TaxID=2785058 RepID=A0ABR9ZZD0_9FIRM|nr:energy-coupling factor transporter ATPase [Fusibacter ferrireducens]MBF4695816.1 energy-coupling factor transporter ATPase [Fusibacter ferrireducens]
MSISIKHLSHIYDYGTPNETVAIENINLEIEHGEFIGLIGHTGSGKSTLIQQLNGLLKPSKGTILVNGLNITEGLSNLDKTKKRSKSEQRKLAKERKRKLLEVRKKVGLVFQYPEYQLFEETIEKDIAFGPTNLGLGESEVKARVKEAMMLVGIDYDAYKDRSPFELSGGQKRRVAIAGVLAMRPEVLILDEPTAGLDPRGRDEILAQIKALHDKNKMTVIIVSHSMEDMAKIANRLIVMNKGKVVFDDSPHKVFKEIETLEKIGLAVPQISYLARALNEAGFHLSDEIITIEEAVEALKKQLPAIHPKAQNSKGGKASC